VADVEDLTSFYRLSAQRSREIVSLTRRALFSFTGIPGINFCYMLSQAQGHNAAGRFRPNKKIQ
jgi:hypothetical protein